MKDFTRHYKNVQELDKAFKELLTANDLPFEALKAKLELLFAGQTVLGTLFDPGIFFHRANIYPYWQQPITWLEENGEVIVRDKNGEIIEPN